jgi:hypothetical protein
VPNWKFTIKGSFTMLQIWGFYPKTGAFSMNGGISEGFLIFRVKWGLFEAKNLDHLDGDGRI